MSSSHPVHPAGARTAPSPDFEELVEHLSGPGGHPLEGSEVEVLRRRDSVLFLTRLRAYRLKRPEPLARPGRSRLESRRRSCEEEVRLNRRISPRTYTGIRPVTRERDGGLVVDGQGEPVDWVSEMVRLPAHGMLDARLGDGRVEPRHLEQVAEVVARFHRRAMTGPPHNRRGTWSEISSRVSNDLALLDYLAVRHPRRLSRAMVGFLSRDLEGFLEHRRDLLERRVADWRIRDGHGDLLARHVCLDGEQVHVFGCVERERGLRSGDVAWDLATLIADIDQLGHPEQAGGIARRYAEVTQDPELPELLQFYKVLRTLLRAKAALAATVQPRPERGAAEEAAERLVQLAVGYRLAPRLVVVERGRPAAPRECAAYLASRLRAELVHDGRHDAGPSSEQLAGPLRRGIPVVVDSVGVGAEGRGTWECIAKRFDVPCFVVRPHDGSREEVSARDPVVRVKPDATPVAVGRALLERMLVRPSTGAVRTQPLDPAERPSP